MKISRGSYWLKAGSYSFLQNITNLLFGFGGFFLLVRVLSKDQFGVWVLFITVTSILGMIRQSLLRNGLIIFLADNKKYDENEVRFSSLILNILITAAGICIIFVTAPFLSDLWKAPELTFILRIFCLTALILVPFTQLEYYFQAKLNFKAIFIGNLLRNGSFFAFVCGVYFGMIPSLLDILVLLHLASGAIGSLTYIYLGRNDMIRVASLNWRYIKALFAYGKYVLGTGLSAILNTSVDQFMIGSLMDTASVALYNASNRVVTLVSIPSTVIASIVFPKSAEVGAEKKLSALKDLYEKSLAVNMAIIFPAVAVIMIFPALIIKIVAGSEYLEAVPYLRWMMIIAIFIPPARLFGTILDSLGKPQINFYVTSISAVINVGLNYFLIKEYGVLGAIFGSIIVLLVAFVVMQIILKRKIDASFSAIFSYMISFYEDFILKILKKST